MPQKPIIAFLPCRKGSQRVKEKNTRPFGSPDTNLTSIKLQQLLDAEHIADILVSSNDEKVLAIAESFADPRIRISKRPDHLGSSETSTDDLITHVPEILDDDCVVLWTHVTSPFITSAVYDEAIEKYFTLDETRYDSMASVTKIQKFLWNENGPINYDRNKEKWPRTQTLDPLYEINSGFFLADRSIYTDQDDRMGSHPFLFELEERMSMDIDWEEDFTIAEELWRADNLS